VTAITGAVPRDGRRERSRRTRARVVDAATRQFVETGYLSATIESVAERAGVAVQTVYYVFGTKRNLLTAVLDAGIVGEAEPVPVLEQTWVQTLEDEDDALSAVTALVAGAVAIIARAAPIYEVVRQASSDPEVAALLDDNRRRRRADQRRLVETLQQSGHLRAGLDLETAADVFYGLMNEEVFQLFTVDCGWSIERFQRWATVTMVQQLVDGSGVGNSEGSGRASHLR
jgi:AcrR family transcriptional regulator